MGNENNQPSKSKNIIKETDQKHVTHISESASDKL